MTEDKRPFHEIELLDTDRIKMLGDGIFAIVMTILVLDLRVPEGLDLSMPGEFSRMVRELWPNFASFVISFVLLGIFWIGHNFQFHYLKHATRKLFWINIAFYLFVSLVPFSAAFLARYFDHQAAIVLYATNLIIVSIILAANWYYADQVAGLVDVEFPDGFAQQAMRYMLLAPVLYVAAIVISFWAIWPSLLIFLIMPIYYIFPSPIDEFLPIRRRKGARNSHGKK